jgi:hypothetical protein
VALSYRGLQGGERDVTQQPSGLQWLIVVRRERPDLYQNLLEAFDGIQGVAVILDRRQAERRQEAAAPGGGRPDRRRRQRRRAATPVERDLWETAGFRLVHAAEGLQVFEAVPRPPA